MAFGLCNATATFQWLMELALSGLQWNSCLVYLDDVIVYSKDSGTHMQRLAAVLTRIQQAGLKLKPFKCQFLKRQVCYTTCTPIKFAENRMSVFCHTLDAHRALVVVLAGRSTLRWGAVKRLPPFHVRTGIAQPVKRAVQRCWR